MIRKVKNELAKPPSVPHWRVVTSQSLVTDEVLRYPYVGSGTEEDPYHVEWIPQDPRNPMLFPSWKKWVMTVTVAFNTLAVSFASTAFSGCIRQVAEDFRVSTEVALLVVSLFVLGFAIGPMTWGPMSELYGRQILHLLTFGFLTIFGAAAAGSKNIQTLVIFRFLAGSIGSSAIVNSAGVVSDMFIARERGLAVTVYCSAPFLGPTLGPIAGGFLGQHAGWKWVNGMTVIFSGLLWIIGGLVVPETYAPVLLIKRAKKLSTMTGKVYKSKLEIEKGAKSAKAVFSIALKRPWILLALEPIVLLLGVYIAIVYGTLYLIFSAFPIVFESERGWSQGISGLSFLGIMTGQITSLVFYSVYLEKRYRRAAAKAGGFLPPEARLIPAMIGSPFLPIGLFWFAWTSQQSVPWIVCIIGSWFFGFGQVLMFLSIINYLVDAYTIYSASVTAANAVLRALFAAAFPLFTTYMYKNLGVQWASSIPAFMSLICTPFPYLFYKYGLQIRVHCRYAAEAKRVLDALQSAARNPSDISSPASGDSSQAATETDNVVGNEIIDRERREKYRKEGEDLSS